MSSEVNIQGVVHKLEEGAWKKWVILGLVIAALLFEISAWFFYLNGSFKGLSHPRAFEQAVIAREIAHGHGFSTTVIRPAALWQFEKNQVPIPIDPLPDTYHAPLNPYIVGITFKALDTVNSSIRSLSLRWKNGSGFTQWLGETLDLVVYDQEMSSKVIVPAYDKFMAGVQIVFFLLAVVVTFFTARRLFDYRLASMSCGLLLICDRLWDFSLSGLPQMLMLFLFSLACYALVRAIECRIGQIPLQEDDDGHPDETLRDDFLKDPDAAIERKKPSGRWGRLLASPHTWLAGVSFCFGLMALTHGLTIFMFFGALLFCVLYFTPRWKTAVIMLSVFILLYSPWLARNYRVCGGFSGMVGISWYSGLMEVRGTEDSIMRSSNPPMEGVQPAYFRKKMQSQAIMQTGNIYAYLGSSLVTPLFFLALLHPFRRREIAILRWPILSILAFGFLGMCIFGMDNQPLKANDLYVLFIPVMTLYGLAFLLNLWSKLQISSIRLLRAAFIALIFVISGLPFLFTNLDFLGQSQAHVQWPPYMPPAIALLGPLTKPDEIIMSDVPWAVAWYAERKSLWLPTAVKDFNRLNDENSLKGRVVGLYLTPYSGNTPFISSIAKGEYKEWSAFITRSVNLGDLKGFPLKAKTALPPDGENVAYFDRDRWTQRED